MKIKQKLDKFFYKHPKLASVIDSMFIRRKYKVTFVVNNQIGHADLLYSPFKKFDKKPYEEILSYNFGGRKAIIIDVKFVGISFNRMKTNKDAVVYKNTMDKKNNKLERVAKKGCNDTEFKEVNLNHNPNGKVKPKRKPRPKKHKRK